MKTLPVYFTTLINYKNKKDEQRYNTENFYRNLTATCILYVIRYIHRIAHKIVKQFPTKPSVRWEQ